MEILILCAVLLVSLFMIPLGLPGLWVMLAAGVGYSILVPNSIGVVTLLGITAIAVIAEVLEWTLAGSYARKYGGSKRAGWGAVIGGMVGAMFIGFGIPIIGHVLGAFFGAFAGALVFEYSREYNHRVATRVAWGALIGRVVAAALKVVAGLLMAIWLVIAAL
jgi:uncharacterized protein YqgC (DUF456 family)